MDGVEALRSVNYGGGHPPATGTIINRLMHRFRPIAPKPVSGDSGSGHAAPEKLSLLVRTKRAKRKYVRVKPKNREEHRNKGTSKGIYNEESRDSSENDVVTLELMPQKADLVKFRQSEEEFLIDLNVTENLDSSKMMMMSGYTASKDLVIDGGRATDQSRPVAEIRAVESWVVVESVTGTCGDNGGLGRTDMSRMKTLEADSCPGFISDGHNHRVLWVNKAYKDMVMSWLGRKIIAGSPEPEVSVQMVINEQLELVVGDMGAGSFACVVRVSYNDEQKWKCRRVLPCDVWRMDFGGVAWRLDLKAALTLGA